MSNLTVESSETMSRLAEKIVAAVLLVCVVALASPSHGVLADEHASHHLGSGGGEMAGEHGQRRTEFFPSLMSLPSLTPEQRAHIEQTAKSRMDEGIALMSQGVDMLARTNDYTAMHEGIRLIREGLDELQSGLAAQEALSSGVRPQSVALRWFREQTSLGEGEQVAGRTILGLSPIHFFSMVLLLGVGTAALWIYFLRMRRARALLLGLVPGAGGGAASLPPKAEAPTFPTQPLPPQSTGPAPAQDRQTAWEQSAAVPKLTRWNGKLRVLKTFDEIPGVRTFRLANPEGGALPFTYLPGQFLDLTAEISGKQARRSYSIASSPTERDYLEITVKREPFGLMSGYLHQQVKAGNELEIAAPAGRFTFTGAEAKSIALIGGGVGITPLMSVIRYLTAHGWPGETMLLYCFRQPQDFIFREELQYLQERNSNLRVIAAVTRRGQMPWLGLEGRFTKEIIAYSLPNIARYRVHLCGPPPMMEAVRGMLLELGVSKTQIKTEAFGTDQRKPASVVGPMTGIVGVDWPSTAAQKANGLPSAPVVAGKAPAVTFTLSRKSAPLPPEKTVLEAAEEVGVNIAYSCRVGTCGTCKSKLASGSVTMEVDEGLEPGDKELGWILACQARATADIMVEA